MLLIERLEKTTLLTFINNRRPIETAQELEMYLDFQEKLFDKFILEIDHNLINSSGNKELLRYFQFTRERAFDFFAIENPDEKLSLFNKSEIVKRNSRKYLLREESRITELVLIHFRSYGDASAIKELESEIDHFKSENFSFPRASFPFLRDAKSQLVGLLNEIAELGLTKQVFDIVLNNIAISTINDEELKFCCRRLYQHILNLSSSEILWDIIGYCSINIRYLSRTNDIESYFNSKENFAKVLEVLTSHKIMMNNIRGNMWF
jgi:hypothetical protein